MSTFVDMFRVFQHIKFISAQLIQWTNYLIRKQIMDWFGSYR